MEYTSRIMYAGLFVCKLTPIISGCIDKKDLGGIDKNLTPTLTSVNPDSEVPPAPQQLFINPSSSETVQFRGHNIMISDLAISPHLVEVTIDGDTEIIEINRSTKCPGNHCSYYATNNDIDYSIKPVVWTYNEAGERIWSFETWNSNELYFEVHINR